jgi:hypothetical protein
MVLLIGIRSCGQERIFMKRLNVFATILHLAFVSSISVLGLAGCGGDSGPTPGGLAIITTSLPEGQINQPYSASVGGSGGALPYLWSVTPALPAGLSFNTQSGAITGTPRIHLPWWIPPSLRKR